MQTRKGWPEWALGPLPIGYLITIGGVPNLITPMANPGLGSPVYGTLLRLVWGPLQNVVGYPNPCHLGAQSPQPCGLYGLPGI